LTELVLHLAGGLPLSSAILRDGSAVNVRPVSTGDQAALREFLRGVSTKSLNLRFCGGIDRDRAAASLADRPRPGDLALVAQLAGQPSIAAHAALYRTGPNRAEVAFLVADAWQGRGLGSIMFSRLAAAAREHCVTTLMAQVLPENRGMLTVFERSGHPVQIRPGADVIDVQIETTPLPSTLAA
jgi:acetate---CoA ligase (ADP-forming)